MGSALGVQFYSPSHGHTRNAPVLERQEPSVDPLALARRGEATGSPVTVWVLRSPHPGSRRHPCPGEPRSLALPGAKARCPAPGPRAFPGRPARAPGPGRRFRLAGAGGRAPPRPPPAPPRARPRPAPAHLALADAEDSAAVAQAHAGVLGLRGCAAEGERATRGAQPLHRGAHERGRPAPPAHPQVQVAQRDEHGPPAGRGGSRGPGRPHHQPQPALPAGPRLPPYRGPEEAAPWGRGRAELGGGRRGRGGVMEGEGRLCMEWGVGAEG